MMHVLSKRLLLMMCLCALNSMMYAQLLVIKKGEQGFQALDANDEKNKTAIADVLLKYEWPMVIANEALTKQEQDELLTSGKPYAEEEFVRAKLKKIDDRYDVVFIPTAIYELFLIGVYSRSESEKGGLFSFVQNVYGNRLSSAGLTREKKDALLSAIAPLDKGSINSDTSRFVTREEFNKFREKLERKNGAVLLSSRESTVLSSNPEVSSIGFKVDSPKEIRPEGVLGTTKETKHEIYERLYSSYRKNNNFFYPDMFFSMNNIFFDYLFRFFPSLSNEPDGSAISNAIEVKSFNLAAILVVVSGNKVIQKNEMTRDAFNKPSITSIIKPNGVLTQIILTEYEARKLNKALLLRGTKSFMVAKGATQVEVMGSSFYGMDNTINSYNVNESKKYSISFGNSLFAGWVRDKGACAYDYLIEDQHRNHVGYSLFVDKKYYIKNQLVGPYKSLDLFFIVPLAPIAAFFARGEWFHSRTKVPVSFEERDIFEKEGNEPLVLGLFDLGLHLTSLFSVRDPLVHEKLFSGYLAKNMRIISVGDESDLTNDEKKIFEEKRKQKSQELKENQAQLAKYYAAIRTLDRFAHKASVALRQRILERKVQAFGQDMEMEQADFVTVPLDADTSAPMEE